jgi:hypothetical protein
MIIQPGNQTMQKLILATEVSTSIKMPGLWPEGDVRVIVRYWYFSVTKIIGSKKLKKNLL